MFYFHFYLRGVKAAATAQIFPHCESSTAQQIDQRLLYEMFIEWNIWKMCEVATDPLRRKKGIHVKEHSYRMVAYEKNYPSNFL